MPTALPPRWPGAGAVAFGFAIYEIISYAAHMSKEDDALEAWLANQDFSHVEDYVKRGRDFENVPTPELKERWIAAFRQWAANWRHEPTRELQEDLQAELSIRKDTPPFDSVRPEMGTLKRAATEAFRHLKSDPRRFEEVERDLQADLRDFSDSMKVKKKN